MRNKNRAELVMDLYFCKLTFKKKKAKSKEEKRENREVVEVYISL